MKQEIQTMTRVLDGLRIAREARMVKVRDKGQWWVYSLAKEGKFYIVSEDGSCDCPDFQYRGLTCKHAYGVMFRFSVVKIAFEEIEA